MRLIIVCLMALTIVTGCVTKAKSDLLVHQAYLMGQQQALSKPPTKIIIVRGDVKNETVPWTEDMTVAKAIVEAEYEGLADPKRIIVVHNGLAKEIKASELLSGKDLPLEAGDMVVLRKQ